MENSLIYVTFAEPPQPTSDCPRQFGYFRLGDETKCGQFLNCVNGIGYKFDCPEGLAFNELTFRCDWADQVDTCDAEGKKLQYNVITYINNVIINQSVISLVKI